MRSLFVVVSGAPGSGKSTLAHPLAEALGLPLFAKDVVKEALGDSLGAETLDESRRLGGAANEVLLALARANLGGVIESAWIPEIAAPRIGALPSSIVETYCDAPVEESMQRYKQRGPARHPVHFDGARSHDRAAWDAYARPIAGGWPVIRVDTTKPVDIGALAAKVLAVV